MRIGRPLPHARAHTHTRTNEQTHTHTQTHTRTNAPTCTRAQAAIHVDTPLSERAAAWICRRSVRMGPALRGRTPKQRTRCASRTFGESPATVVLALQPVVLALHHGCSTVLQRLFGESPAGSTVHFRLTCAVTCAIVFTACSATYLPREGARESEGGREREGVGGGGNAGRRVWGCVCG